MENHNIVYIASLHFVSLLCVPSRRFRSGDPILTAAALDEVVVLDIVVGALPIEAILRQWVAAFVGCVLLAVVLVHREPIARSPIAVRSAWYLETETAGVVGEVVGVAVALGCAAEGADNSAVAFATPGCRFVSADLWSAH